VRGQIHEYVDGELGENAQVRYEEHVAECDGCRTLQVEVRSVKAAVAGKAARHGAPPYLAVRIRESVERPARPAFWESFRGILVRRPVALAAAFAVILVVLYFGPLNHNDYAVARDITRDCFEDHANCATSTLLSQHVFTRDPAELARILSVRTGKEIRIPDLSDLGHRLIEGHICHVRGETAIHVYYEDGDGDRISLFRVSGIPGSGDLGEEVDLGREAYIPPTDCWEKERANGMHILIWRGKTDCLSILLGPVSELVIERMVMSCVAAEDGGTM